MKAIGAVLVVFLSIPALAAKVKESDYQDGTLKSYRIVASGEKCHTSGDGQNSDTSCSDTGVAQYTIIVGEQTFTVEPATTKKAALGAYASMGWSTTFAKHSVLWGQLPGAVFKIRSEAGTFHIRVGKRESSYRIVSAE